MRNPEALAAREGYGDDVLSIVSRVVTSETRQREPLDTGCSAPLGKARQGLVTCLILLCNLIQFTSMFSTVAGGYEFSARLGRKVGASQANWMPAAFGLTQSAFVLISGRLGAIYGHQRLLLLGGAIFVIFSICNAFCTTYASFVAMRALTGIGGGILMPNAVAVLTIMIPPGRARNYTLALFAASPPIGALIGALITGAILESTDWKWIFVIIACLGVAAFGGLFFAAPREERLAKDGKVDYVGAVLGLGGLILFNVTWNQAPSTGWESPSTIVSLVSSVVMIVFFFVWETWYAAEPIMPVAVFQAPSFKALILVVLFIYMSVGISLWYMVAWEQLIRGWRVLHVAVGWIPYGLGASIAVTGAAWLIPHLEAQYILAVGCLAPLASTMLLATMPEQQLYWAQVLPSTVLGSFRPDFVYVAAQIIASNSVQKHEQGVAGSLIGTLNLHGNSLGLGFAGIIEVQVAKHQDSEVAGYRAALWFGAALLISALVLDLAFVRLRHVDREDWDSEQTPTTVPIPDI
ncbi:MFS general substrate transporter [Aspergillus aculeatinus CBS 121060]|uniref:MFS general substrate transporter n=1 Tax=Aspergillus aculeatinus CBS 121060 TaxID=1448322 RepID=A0ACD1H0K4_9EURO|nr:MFS general substrate transporter [Aspergillus aculeatinus CBS 121060]RAH67277.1 MFS general substrate transporter [Aspergillus aculeatinus CBS 121060]